MRKPGEMAMALEAECQQRMDFVLGLDDPVTDGTLAAGLPANADVGSDPSRNYGEYVMISCRRE